MSLAAADWDAERRDASLGADARKVHVIQGEFHVSDDADLVLTTILGSCVAACVRDPVARVGGMNHFLLPGETGGEGLRYGVQSMELLVNALLRRGARRDRLQGSIARLTADLGPPDSGFLTEVQAVDLLSQRLEGMAAFLRVLAATAPQDVTTDVHAAVMGLTLAEQARRLSGALPDAETPASGGELQLF